MTSKIEPKTFISIGVLAGIVALLDYIGVVGLPFGLFGVSAFYIGAAFFTGIAIWFKGKGLLAMYLGLLLGALISGTFTIFALILAWGNVIGATVPMLLFRSKKLGLNYELKSFKDYLAYIIAVPICQNIISAIWVLGGFYIFGIMPLEGIKVAIFGWVIGGILVTLIVGIPLIKWLSPVIKKTTIYVE